MKHTISCDMVPFCTHDLIIVHKSTTKCKLAGRLALVTKLASVIHFLDVAPKRNCVDQHHLLQEYGMELSAETYYKYEKQYEVILTSNRMVRFIVLDVELCERKNNNSDDSNSNRSRNGNQNTDEASTATLYQGSKTSIDKYALADVLVARESDFGVNDVTFSTVTHLGHIIQPGDTVLGYDLISSSIDWETEENFHHNFILPDIVLVKKTNRMKDEIIQTSTAVKNGARKLPEDAVPPTHGSQPHRISRKKEKRNRKDGKRARELEEHAIRMGFLADMNEEHAIDEQNDIRHLESDRPMDNDDNDRTMQQVDAFMNDPDLAEDILALEQDLQAIYSNDPNINSEFNSNHHDSGADDVDDFEHVSITNLESNNDEEDQVLESYYEGLDEDYVLEDS
jgi:hypothetical protein